jgi:cytochrome P450
MTMAPRRATRVRTPDAEDDALFDQVMAFRGRGLADIHELFAGFRRTDPIHHGDVLGELGLRTPLVGARIGGDVYSLFRHADVTAILRDPSTSVEIMNDTVGQVFGRTIITMDPPDHRAQKALLQSVFSAKTIAAWREDLFRPVVETYVDSLLP